MRSMSLSSSKPRFQETFAFLSGGETCADLIAESDWSQSLLGPVDLLPPSLQTTLFTILCSRVPMASFWGHEGFSYTVTITPAWQVGGIPHSWAGSCTKLGRSMRSFIARSFQGCC